MVRNLSILFEIGQMNVGGPQSWLCDIAPALRRRGSKVAVMSFEGREPGDLVLLQRLQAEGIETRRVPVWGGRWRRRRAIHAAFKALGPCDIAHFLSEAYSGPFLPVAKRYGIPIRISHARSPVWRSLSPGLLVKLRYRWYWWLSLRYCTHAFGVTQEALDAMLAPAGRRRIPCHVVPSAICFARFSRCADMRGHHGRAKNKNDLVLGFVGRISPSKNPEFLVKVLSVLRARGGEARGVLLGSGSAEAQVREFIALEGLSDRVEIIPPRMDVAEVMAQRMDIVLLPSDFEGTPRVVVESQACGVPVLCSTAVSTSVCVVPELFHRLPLADGPAAWADTVLRVAKVRVPMKRVAECFARSALEIENQADHLLELYQGFRE